jgi:hypothetical protein
MMWDRRVSSEWMWMVSGMMLNGIYSTIGVYSIAW